MTPVPSSEARRAIPSGFLFVLLLATTVYADPIASSGIYVIDGDTIDVRGRRNLPVRPSTTAPAKRTGQQRRHLLLIFSTASLQRRIG